MATFEQILLGVGIDATLAKKGGKEVESSLDRISKGAVRTDSAFQRMGKSTAGVFDNMGKRVAGLAGTYLSFAGVVKATNLAARFETLGVVMNNVGANAGKAADDMAFFEDGVRSMGITMNQSRLTLTKMVQSQIDLTNATQLARVAQDAAVIGNVNSSEALGRLLHGIQSAQVEVLRTIGLNVNFERSYKRLAAELGKTTESLTEAEKVQARVSETFEAGRFIAGTYESSMQTVGKQFASLARLTEDAGVKLGEVFKPAFATIVRELTISLKSFNKQLDEAGGEGGLISSFGDAFEKAANIGTRAAKFWAGTIDQIGTAAAAAGAVITGDLGVGEALDEIRRKGQETINSMTEVIDRAEEARRTFLVPVKTGEIQGLPTFSFEKQVAQSADDEDRLRKLVKENSAERARALGILNATEQLQREIGNIAGKTTKELELQTRNAKASTAEAKALQELESGRLKTINDIATLSAEAVRRDINGQRQRISAIDAELKSINDVADAEKRINELQTERQQQLSGIQSKEAQIRSIIEAQAAKTRILSAARAVDAANTEKQLLKLIDSASPFAKISQELEQIRRLAPNNEVFRAAANDILGLSDAQTKLTQDLTRYGIALNEGLITQEQYNLLISDAKFENDEYTRSFQRLSQERERELDLLMQSSELQLAELALSKQRRGLTSLEFQAEQNKIFREQIDLLKQRKSELQDAGGSQESINQITSQIVALESQVKTLGETFDDIGQGAFSGFFESVLNGTSSIKDAFSDMADNIIQSINRIVAQQFAEQIIGGIGFGQTGPSAAGGGGGGGFLGGALGGLFGMKNGGSFMVGGSGGIDSQVVAFKASPNERVTVETPEQQRRGGAGGGMVINNNFTINSADGQISRESQQQVAAAAANALNQARRRNG